MDGKFIFQDISELNPNLLKVGASGILQGHARKGLAQKIFQDFGAGMPHSKFSEAAGVKFFWLSLAFTCLLLACHSMHVKIAKAPRRFTQSRTNKTSRLWYTPHLHRNCITAREAHARLRVPTISIRLSSMERMESISNMR